MTEKQYHRGSAVIIEVEFKKRLPFGDEVLFDPIQATAEVVDPEGEKKAQAQLNRHSTGKYYYIVQTGEDWRTGVYSVKIRATDGTQEDITVEHSGFRLI